jgi:flagellar protein FlaG
MRVDAIDNLIPAVATPQTTAPAYSAAAAGATQPVNKESIQTAVKTANEIAAGSQSGIEFSVDGESGRTIVRVVDTRTQEVIRQIPSEDMLRLRRALESLRGLLFDQRV